MAKKGRKEKYDSHVKPYLDRIPIWRRQGMTEEQIAEKLGIHVGTLWVYKKQFIELNEVLKRGCAELIEELEETLYTRAKGSEYEEVKVIIDKDESGRDRKRIEKTKKITHSDACLLFALKNLNSSKWRDKQVIEHEEQKALPREEVDKYLQKLYEKRSQEPDEVVTNGNLEREAE